MVMIFKKNSLSLVCGKQRQPSPVFIFKFCIKTGNIYYDNDPMGAAV